MIVQISFLLVHESDVRIFEKGLFSSGNRPTISRPPTHRPVTPHSKPNHLGGAVRERFRQNENKNENQWDSGKKMTKMIFTPKWPPWSKFYFWFSLWGGGFRQSVRIQTNLSGFIVKANGHSGRFSRACNEIKLITTTTWAKLMSCYITTHRDNIPPLLFVKGQAWHSSWMLVQVVIRVSCLGSNNCADARHWSLVSSRIGEFIS